MSSTASAAAGDVLPALPPIRTTATPSPSQPRAEEAARSSSPAASSSTAPDAESWPSTHAAGVKWEEEEAEPTTPTSEESRLPPPTVCPPAPRKPAWVAPPAPAPKRKFPSTTAPPPAPAPRAFFPVVRDLTAVFRPLPPKKRIRAG